MNNTSLLNTTSLSEDEIKLMYADIRLFSKVHRMNLHHERHKQMIHVAHDLSRSKMTSVHMELDNILKNLINPNKGTRMKKQYAVCRDDVILLENVDEAKKEAESSLVQDPERTFYIVEVIGKVSNGVQWDMKQTRRKQGGVHL